MAVYDAIIIGSGLGGLLCGNILSKEGYNVCVIEKNQQLGGCLQTFVRDKCIFNTGLNYTEGLADGQILNQYFKYFGLLDKLKLKRLDEDGFDRITFNGNEYNLAQGDENFVERLSEKFPSERQALKNYINELKNICNQFPLYNLEADPDVDLSGVFSGGAYDYISSVTSDNVLRNVLAGNNLLYGGVIEKTPLYLHALITYSFISSAWRLVDGSQQLVNLLSREIRKNGGTIIRNAEVKKLISENGQIRYAELGNSEKIEGKNFISNIHPVNTFKMLDSNLFTKAFVNRILGLENTVSSFSIYASFKENSFEYQNFNNYVYSGKTSWITSSYNSRNWPQGYLFYTPSSSKSDMFAESFIAITFMNFDEVGKWENTTVENRGDDYLEFKRKKTEAFLTLIEKKFPGIKGKIKNVYSSTPLTFRDYTGTPGGSSYGILKDFRNTYSTIISPRTRVPNLFFTGQNLNLHGILGVTIGAVMTCGEMIGIESLISKIKNS